MSFAQVRRCDQAVGDRSHAGGSRRQPDTRYLESASQPCDHDEPWHAGACRSTAMSQAGCLAHGRRAGSSSHKTVQSVLFWVHGPQRPSSSRSSRDGSSGELLAFRAMTFRTSEHLASRSSEDARSAVTAVDLPKSVEMGGRGLALRQVCLHLCRFGFMVCHTGQPAWLLSSSQAPLDRLL